MSYQREQASGKALKRLARSLPLSTRKQHFVVAKTAKQVGLEEKNLKKSSRYRLKLRNHNIVEKVKHFNSKNEISWQAPGRQDYSRTDTGEKVKRAAQTWYLLMSVEETSHIHPRKGS